ncbi:MAG: UvrD-helicase domain-containing protein [Pyrinomonadaceae bacterium]|nr:UvrD-helicase domain-containing protein [Pyrinomonadaceae bacterium]
MSLPTQKHELLPEQAAAAYEIDKHISVTAGPGSGKTTVLVERYLHILRQHPELNIDQIVAITFTNRAANEMRERLRAGLNQILQAATGEERRRWLAYKRTLDGAVITTIHGFCARLLREFPVEARIDPQFLLLDEHRAAMLLESTVEAALTEFISSGHVAISRLTLGVGRGKLAEALAQLYRDVRGQGLTPAELAMKTARSHATENDHAQALVELSHAMNEFLAVRRTTAAQKLNQAEVASGWRSFQPLIQDIPEVENLADYCRSIEGFRSLRPPARAELKPYVNALDQLIWEKDLAGRVPQISLDLFARDYALELVNVLSRIDERLNEEKKKPSALDFDDLEIRTLELLNHPEVITRAAERYKFFLVDEFQDTNGLQRALLEQLVLRTGRRDSANLFIVGDGKQSIYGFRGADVDVFHEMTATLVDAGGEETPLRLNFRSQPPLISFFNYLFAQLFQPKEEVVPQDLKQLGYVSHELSESKREVRDSGPLVELMITTEASGEDNDPKAEQSSRELDAEQLALRIIALTAGSAPSVRYSDIALLFRAMTNIQTYESAFRRANIPYQTVLGRGFYERPEITDLIQLLRFLDNKTDEIALAAVLRSPLWGISDNALLALRCGPGLTESGEAETEQLLRHFTQTRRLVRALREHRNIAFISDEEHELLDRASALINELIARRHHYALGDLLRFAVEQSEYLTVVAANFDGAQRLANVERLFTLAERFERSGTHLIRDFVRYVEEFEAIGSRESEGQIDEAANAVKLMTIHQAKGLEFPVVIIPELQRRSRVSDNWFLLDRHRGLTLKVPDGRGKQVAGCAFSSFEQRHGWREEFESMRLLYVAATRAQDRLILSGTTKDLASLDGKSDTWLKWIWQSLGLPEQRQSGIVNLAEGAQIELTLNLADEPQAEIARATDAAPGDAIAAIAAIGAIGQIAENAGSLIDAFPLLRPIEVTDSTAVHRFSVTQLINYQRCPRQYYFDRILHLPSADQIAVWNDAEAPEPPANLTATLKGAVIHRFCETYTTGEALEDALRRSFDDVIRSRQAELADRLVEINFEAGVAELLPLAQNYLSSGVFERVERARALSEPPALAGGPPSLNNKFPSGRRVEAGIWSELSFRVRRPLGILSGAIDKLLVTPAANGKGFDVEIIDFKTNRLRIRAGVSASSLGPRASRPHSADGDAKLSVTEGVRAIQHPSGDAPPGTPRRPRSQQRVEQFAFDFTAAVTKAEDTIPLEFALDDQVRIAASDYQLQMQAYALAVSELMPALMKDQSSIISTLHFLEPNVEFHLDPELLRPEACARAIDEAMMEIAASREPGQFPVRPARHCRICNFLGICPPGRDWLRSIGSEYRLQAGSTQ